MSAECTECGTDLMAHADNMDFWCPVCAYYEQKEKLAITVEALERIADENDYLDGHLHKDFAKEALDKVKEIE